MTATAHTSFRLTSLPLTPGGGGGTLGIFGWGYAAVTLEALAHSRARQSEFCYPT